MTTRVEHLYEVAYDGEFVEADMRVIELAFERMAQRLGAKVKDIHYRGSILQNTPAGTELEPQRDGFLLVVQATIPDNHAIDVVG